MNNYYYFYHHLNTIQTQYDMCHQSNVITSIKRYRYRLKYSNNTSRTYKNIINRQAYTYRPTNIMTSILYELHILLLLT
jgi:hypothetical protein